MSINEEQKITKIAVVSGATGYVGSEIIKRLASDGMCIAMLYYHAPKETVSQMLAALPGKGHRAYQCDLENAENVAQTVETIEQNQGRIYACVHAAGILPKRKQLYLSSVEDLKEQFGVNVFGSFNFLSACARRLKEHRGGVILGITTVAVVSQVNTRALGAYVPAKFGVQGMLVALKEELAPFHVRVYSVAPGFMPGGMNRDMPQAFLDIAKEKSPTKTLAEASDVAAVVSFLCSDDSLHLSNLTLAVAPESGFM